MLGEHTNYHSLLCNFIHFSATSTLWFKYSARVLNLLASFIEVAVEDSHHAEQAIP